MPSKKENVYNREKSRHIPNDVSKALHEMHFFECAWCSTNLTEQHHIEHYALGGAHSVDNLILLCPNCHTQVHNGNISQSELRLRKSTHLEADRIGGNVSFKLNEPRFKIGGVSIINTPYLLVYKNSVLLDWKRNKVGQIFLHARLYDENGNLVFWMADDRYWAPSTFAVSCQKSNLTISCSSTPFFYLNLYKENNLVCVEGLSFIGGQGLLLSPEYIVLGERGLISNSSIENCGGGIYIG